MDRCPNCRARLDDAPTCRRCGIDLARLRQIEHAADAVLVRGLSRLADGDADAAAHHLRHALSLRRSPLATSLLALSKACR